MQSWSTCASYLSNILWVRAHVLLKHKELVPHPAPLDPLESSGTSIPSCRRWPRLAVGPLLPWPALEGSAGALLKEEAQEQQQAVPPQHWAVCYGTVPTSRSRGKMGSERQEIQGSEAHELEREASGDWGEVRGLVLYHSPRWRNDSGQPGSRFITCNWKKINKNRNSVV